MRRKSGTGMNFGFSKQGVEGVEPGAGLVQLWTNIATVSFETKTHQLEGL